MGILLNVHTLSVEQAVRQQEDLHAELSCGGVLFGIVAHHQAFFGGDAQFLQHRLIVAGIGLAVGIILVGGVKLKILDVQTCPADPALGSDPGEEGIGGKGSPQSFGFHQGDGLGCSGIAAAGGTDLLEFVFVEAEECRFVSLPVGTYQTAEDIPEMFFVGFLAGIGHHGFGACPEGFEEGVGIVALRRQGFGQQTEICLDEFVLIHGQQGAVQIE